MHGRSAIPATQPLNSIKIFLYHTIETQKKGSIYSVSHRAQIACMTYCRALSCSFLIILMDYLRETK